MPGKSRTKPKRRGGQAPRRLSDDLQRHQIARDVAPQVVESIEEFLTETSRLARRRIFDRIVAHTQLASDILAWTALMAPRDERRLGARCFAAACFVVSDPHRLAWVVLASSGVDSEVRAYVRSAAAEVDGPDVAIQGGPAPGDTAGPVPDEVQALGERLSSGQAAWDDGLRVGELLLDAATRLDLDNSPDGDLGSPFAPGAFWLLERRAPGSALAIGPALHTLLTGMEQAVPDIVAHAAAHLEEGPVPDEDEVDDAWDDEEEEEGPDLEDILPAFDMRLRTTEDAAEGASLAHDLAAAFLAQSLTIETQAADLDVRSACATAALVADAELPDLGELRATYLSAAALLGADLELPPTEQDEADEAERVEEDLALLDMLVGTISELADSDLITEPAGGLALLGAAGQALQAGLRLGHPDPRQQQQMAAALGLLDPLALVVMPEAREGAAARLRELGAVTSR